MDDFGQGSQAVGGAGGIANNTKTDTVSTIQFSSHRMKYLHLNQGTTELKNVQCECPRQWYVT